MSDILHIILLLNQQKLINFSFFVFDVVSSRTRVVKNHPHHRTCCFGGRTRRLNLGISGCRRGRSFTFWTNTSVNACIPNVRSLDRELNPRPLAYGNTVVVKGTTTLTMRTFSHERMVNSCLYNVACTIITQIGSHNK
jgi:hypothetical protein